MRCAFSVRALPISVFFDCITSRASVALRVLRTTTWKLHVVGLYEGLCDIKLFTFLWWVSGSAVRRSVVNGNYVMSNYVTLRRQRPVCQFSWCPQRDLSPLWPVIKLQNSSAADVRQESTPSVHFRGYFNCFAEDETSDSPRLRQHRCWIPEEPGPLSSHLAVQILLQNHSTMMKTITYRQLSQPKPRGRQQGWWVKPPYSFTQFYFG